MRINLIDEEAKWKQVGFRELGEKWVGSFSHKDAKPNAWYYLIEPDDFDKKLTRSLRLKDDEHVLRYETETTKIGGMRPFVKINIVKGLVYFLEDLEKDNLEFSKRGSKIIWANLRQSYFYPESIWESLKRNLKK